MKPVFAILAALTAMTYAAPAPEGEGVANTDKR